MLRVSATLKLRVDCVCKLEGGTFMFRTLKMMAAGLVTAIFMAGSASALTHVSAGGSYDITSDNLFFGAVNSGAGGPGTYSVNFTSPVDPLLGKAGASITLRLLNAAFPVGLTMSWVDANNPGNVLATTAVLGGVTTKLNTIFSSASPNTLNQNLVFTWASHPRQTCQFDFDVSAVPLPAGGLTASDRAWRSGVNAAAQSCGLTQAHNPDQYVEGPFRGPFSFGLIRSCRPLPGAASRSFAWHLSRIRGCDCPD